MVLARSPNPRLSHSIGMGSKREPNANMGNLVTSFCHWSYSYWRKGLNGFGFRFTEFQRVERRQEGEKRWSTNACLYLYRVFSLPFLPLCFLFFSSMILSFFFHTLLLLSVPYSWLPPFLLYCMNPWDFSLFSLRLHQPFLVSYGRLSRITH